MPKFLAVLESISELLFPQLVVREQLLETPSGPVVLSIRRNLRARRYILRVSKGRRVRLTIPRRGTLIEARAFLKRQANWIEHQLRAQSQQNGASRGWVSGSDVLLRGERVRIELIAGGDRVKIRFGPESFVCPAPVQDLRACVEKYLWRIAKAELAARVRELAAAHQFRVLKISVRNQRTRWGSCSARGTVCLNWRLIQAPDWVRDYIIFHELAHLLHMNHSRNFWAEVRRMCPESGRAESWIKEHQELLPG